jgi:hypothetical protein
MDTNSHLNSVADTDHTTAELLTQSRVRNYFPLYFINIQCINLRNSYKLRGSVFSKF